MEPTGCTQGRITTSRVVLKPRVVASDHSRKWLVGAHEVQVWAARFGFQVDLRGADVGSLILECGREMGAKRLMRGQRSARSDRSCLALSR